MKAYRLKLSKPDVNIDHREIHINDKFVIVKKNVVEYNVTVKDNEDVSVYVVDVAGESKSDPSPTLVLSERQLKTPAKPEVLSVMEYKSFKPGN